MDSLTKYRQVIEEILTEYARIPYAHGQIDRLPVFDRERDHYLLMIAGWDKRREHGCIVHVDIKDGKIWIQRDGTEDGIARELEAAGVPKQDIVLAFKPPEVRKHTGYAVA